MTLREVARGGLFRDERGSVSSKRVVGVSSAFTLILIALGQLVLPAVFHYFDSDHPPVLTVQESVVTALAAVVIGVFVTTSADKFSPGGKVDAEVQRARASREMGAIPETKPDA